MENPIKMDDLGKPTIFGNIHLNSSQFGAPWFPYLFTTFSGDQAAGRSLSTASPSSNCPTERIRTETAGRGPAGGPASPIWTRNASSKEAMHVRAFEDVGSGSWVGTNIPYKIQNEFKLSVLEGFF